MLERILTFLTEIGIDVVEAPLDRQCFLPGLSIRENKIIMDRSLLLYPGDVLHEAGHLAVTPPEERNLIGTHCMDPRWPSDGDEIAAITWSYAALMQLGIPLEVVFHPNGYKNQSDWIVEQFENGNYLGLPLLQWMGLCSAENFPVMKKWLR